MPEGPGTLHSVSMKLGIVLGQTHPGLGDLATQVAGVLHVQVGFHVPRH